MVLGLSLPVFTALHVLISLIGIATGIAFVIGLLAGRWLGRWNVVFLVTTILTSVTGFFFPSKMIGPPHILGAISLVILAAALLALQTGWRKSYIGCAVAALYLNAFVGVVQAFDKIAPLHALAPDGAGPVFAGAQGIVLVAFIAIGVIAVRRSPGPRAQAGTV